MQCAKWTLRLVSFAKIPDAGIIHSYLYAVSAAAAVPTTTTTTAQWKTRSKNRVVIPILCVDETSTAVRFTDLYNIRIQRMIGMKKIRIFYRKSERKVLTPFYDYC